MKLSHLTDSQLARMFNSGAPMLFCGPPGCGKTQRVGQFAESQRIGMVTFHLTSIDAPDVRGFAIPQKTDRGGAVTVFTKSPILEMIERTGKEQGILFLDELLQADHLVQKAIAPTLSERMVGENKLPDGWVVWAASNRVSDRAGVNRMLGHVTNRLCIINVEGEVVGWLSWANEAGLHPMALAFAQARPGVIFHNEPPKNPDEPYCTPRSWTNAMLFLAQDLQDGDMQLPDDIVSQESVSGFIGEGAAAEAFSFFKVVNELPTIDDILADPRKAKLPPEERLDAQYAASSMLVHHATPDTVDKLFTYCTRLNKEMQASTARQLVEKGGGMLLNSPAIKKWIAENKSLITATLDT